MKRLSLLALFVACGTPHKYMSARPMSAPFSPHEVTTGEDYHDWGKNPWIDASKDHLSTFAADVDTASFTIARRKVTDGELPPAASVRVEEWVNYFHYRFPRATATPFSVAMEAAPPTFATDRSA